MARAEQYYHALLRSHGWRTYLPAPPAEEQLAGMEENATWEMPAFDADPEVAAALARFGLTSDF